MKANLDPEILAAAVGELVARGAAREIAHPTPAELFAFANLELDEESAEEIREHLAICRECSDRMLAFEPLFAEKAPISAPRARWGQWLAAAALVTAIGSSIYFWPRPPAATSPALLELTMVEDVAWRSNPDLDPPRVASAMADEPLVLIFDLRPMDSDEVAVVVRVAENSATVRWQGTLPVRAGGLTTLQFPAGSLEPGLYLAEVQPKAGGPARTYSFRVLVTGQP